ncbi:hypothetical protein VNO80_21243 [Phaseolus coccineus]|uniref:Uncharacterized protein n=1 Tax=Phaseolus coccineus TaxID=3886 RepID=A0AAN9M242_PHACN
MFSPSHDKVTRKPQLKSPFKVLYDEGMSINIFCWQLYYELLVANKICFVIFLDSFRVIMSNGKLFSRLKSSSRLLDL